MYKQNISSIPTFDSSQKTKIIKNLLLKYTNENIFWADCKDNLCKFCHRYKVMVDPGADLETHGMLVEWITRLEALIEFWLRTLPILVAGLNLVRVVSQKLHLTLLCSF